MTKRERALFKALKRLRDEIWNSGVSDAFEGRLNKAYIAANSLIATIERENAHRVRRATPQNSTGGGDV